MGKGRIELKINRVRRLASLARLLAGVMALTLVNLVTAAGPGWVPSFEQALQIARQQGKPIFVDFSTSWCGVCKQMDRSTLADPEIIQRLDNFVKVKVDGDARQDLCSAYGVAAYPTFIHLDPNGRILDKREGFMRVQDLASTLDRTFQTVSASSTAIAQAANRGEQQSRQAPGGNGGQAGAAPAVATTGLQLLSAPGQGNPRETRTVAQSRETEPSGERENTERDSSENVSYDRSDPRLQGSVYAMGASPTSERRSRFGSAAGQNGLRELAEATAQPGTIEQTGSTEEAPEKSEESADSKASQDESSKSDEKSESEEKKIAEKADDETKSDKAEESAKLIAETKAKAEADRKALEQKPTEVANAAPSPVIQSRLTALADEELPKPLLSRTVSGVSQAMTPAPTVSGGAAADPLATIRRIQGGNGKPAEPAAAPKVTAKTQEITPAKVVEKPTVTEKKVESANSDDAPKKEPGREVASATEKKPTASSSSSTKSSESKADPDKKQAEDSAPKTEEGASRSDIERWMKEADSKLVSNRKKEARAMYSKVVEKDPKNLFGKSDMAYVKMVSLIVDKDSDMLRRQAYNKIKEFDARYPDSEHKDYYTLIRAILAADLGETNEAHRLLGPYPERFPESKYRKIAHDTWKDLPPLKKESSSKSSKRSADSGSKRSSRDG